jgi:hypothetical protein
MYENWRRILLADEKGVRFKSWIVFLVKKVQ